MSTINLADVKVSYEGQNNTAINLLAKLQTQLQEVACRLATISQTLGDLQTALLNSETIEVRLTLNQDDLARLRALEGATDSERIRKAVFAALKPQNAPPEANRGDSSGESQDTSSPIYEFRPAGAKAAEKVAPPMAADSGGKDVASTNCPTCHSPMDLPAISNELWSVEIQCPSCGAKSLIRSKSLSAAKTEPAGPASAGETGYRKLFDALSR